MRENRNDRVRGRQRRINEFLESQNRGGGINEQGLEEEEWQERGRIAAEWLKVSSTNWGAVTLGTRTHHEESPEHFEDLLGGICSIQLCMKDLWHCQSEEVCSKKRPRICPHKKKLLWFSIDKISETWGLSSAQMEKTDSTITLDFNANLVKIGLYSIFIPHVKHLAGTFNPEWLTRGTRMRKQVAGIEPEKFRQQRSLLKRMWADCSHVLSVRNRRLLGTVQTDFVRWKKQEEENRRFFSSDGTEEDGDAWCKLCEISDIVT